MTGLNVEPVVVAEASIQHSIAKYYGTSREIELAAVSNEEAVYARNGNGKADGGITHDDLVSLDSLDFDEDHEGDVQILEDNEEIDLATLSRMVAQMIGIGEQTGALDAMLGKIADFYEQEVDSAIANLLTLIEPLLIGFLGVTIGSIVIAMYLPLFTLIGKLSQGH